MSSLAVVSNVTSEKVQAVGSHQSVGASMRYAVSSAALESDNHDETINDSGERELVLGVMLRMIRDLYINSRAGGNGAAYAKICRAKIRGAISYLLDKSNDPFSFRWSCDIFQLDPDKLLQRILFDPETCSHLVREGARLFEGRQTAGYRRAEPVSGATSWLWEDAPVKYQLSEKPGDFVVKLKGIDAARWIASLERTNFRYQIEEFPLTSGNVVLVLRVR